MKEIIVSKLQKIEKEKDITILFAVEAGSRAWGFPSVNSDYDVRFVYVRKLKEYFTINNVRDSIEIMDGDFDFVGWDIKKALGLLYKCNPSIYEWLQSPIIYMERNGYHERMGIWLKKFFDRQAIMYHYHHMAFRNFKKYLANTEVSYKKYLYVLRPLATIIHMMGIHGVPPLNFRDVLKAIPIDEHVRDAIEQVLIAKESGEEMGMTPQIPLLHNWIEEYLKYKEFSYDFTRPPIAFLDEKLYTTIQENNQ